MFDKHRRKEAERAYDRQLERWTADRAWYAELLRLAREFDGVQSGALVLKPREARYLSVTGAGLIEERRGAAHVEGRSQGISVPIGHVAGHPVRYRVGATTGHVVQGDPHPTAIDTGTAHITDQRVVFQGSAQTRECAFAKLIGIQRSAGDATTTFSVSNRQKPTTIAYGAAVAPQFDFRLDLALAHFTGTVGALIDRLTAELATIDSAHPVKTE